MAMYGLFLETYRCPDGAELVLDTHSRPESLFFRSRTTRRELLRLEIEDLKNPVVVEFVNAREDADRIKFFSQFGALGYDPPLPPDSSLRRDESIPLAGA